MNKDFGYFGKDDAGYAQYMAAFGRNFDDDFEDEDEFEEDFDEEAFDEDSFDDFDE